MTEAFHGNGINRRSFLKQSGGALLTLGLVHLTPIAAGPSQAAESRLPKLRSYKSFDDVYREGWTWDKMVHSSHARANCISGCSWLIFVKDGIAWREEQNAIYRSQEPGVVPDFNPRGCQKGASYTSLMYEASRILHPLMRAGERGSGKWKRVSWEEALTAIADKMIDAAVSEGTGSIVYDHGTTNIDFGADTAGEMRFFSVLNATTLDSWAGVGDMPSGAAQTWGMYNVEGTSDDWFKSDFIIVWCGNPSVSRMPEMHFMHEARYRGGKLVVVSPDFSPTATHADYWLNPRIGTDAALALAMAQVILSEGLHDEDYIREQTDLSILVRDDTGRFLRESDLEEGGNEDLLYFWDAARDQLAVVPGCEGEGSNSLALGDLKPTLAGKHSVKLANGEQVQVRPLLDQMRDHLNASYTPEQAAEITGVGAEAIRRIAREMAGVERAMIYCSWGACKHYHSDLFQRAQILLMALTGNQGKSGGGLRVASWWRVDGFHRLANPRVVSSIPFMERMRLLWSTFYRRTLGGGIGWRDFEKLMQRMAPYRNGTPLMPFLYAHGGYQEIWDRRDYNDPALPRETSEYMKEAVDKSWVPIRPLPGSEPRVFVFTGPNPLRRWPAPQYAEKGLWPKLNMIVDVNFKASTSGMKGDVILPASSYYERDSLKYSQAYLPYLLLCEKAVEPLGEAKPEWEIFGLLARRLQERAIERGVGPVSDGLGGEIDLTRTYEYWSNEGEHDPTDPRTAIDWILKNTPATGNLGWAEAEKTGILPIVEASGGPDPLYAVATDYRPDRTLYPHARMVENKEGWPTYTGRQQFLLEHPWYEEAGENLPVHKEPPGAGGDYPLRISGGHTRWSIHATWRDTELMLRLQRGEPAAWIAVRDAEERGIIDDDRIRVYNDVGWFECIAKVAPSVQPGEVIMYHAWEPYQFKSWKGPQEPVPAPWKALHLAGGYGQLHYRGIYLTPSHSPRAQAVEMVKVS